MYLFQNGQTVVELPRPKYQAARSADAAADANNASSPTPGVLERILVNNGDKVNKTTIYYYLRTFRRLHKSMLIKIEVNPPT